MSISQEGSNDAHVAVLCEYDALPEIGHACGHNLIAEVGVGAAIGIKAAMESKGLQGKVKITSLIISPRAYII